MKFINDIYTHSKPRDMIKDGILYSFKNAEYLGSLESGYDYTYNRYCMFRSTKGNYFILRSWFRCEVDGSPDSSRIIPIMNEQAFKIWLSNKDAENYFKVFENCLENA